MLCYLVAINAQKTSVLDNIERIKLSRVEVTYTKICCLYKGTVWECLKGESFGKEVNEVRDGIRLQNRDIELLIFLGRYRIISLDNTRYIYGTVTYHEKRIVNLVKHNYIRRLKHRYITLGTKGKEYLLEKWI